MITLLCVAGLMGLLSLISMLSTSFRKLSVPSFPYAVFVGATVCLLIVSMCWLSDLVAPIASKMVDCRGLSASTIATLRQQGNVCILTDQSTSNDTASSWLTGLLFYFSGAVTVLVALVHTVLHCCWL